MSALYQRQPYLKEQMSVVTSTFQEDDGRFCVSFQDSLFFPQGGGQKGDRGKIKAGETIFTVIDTVRDALSTDGRPLCILDKPALELAEGREAIMQIDWHHRYSQMKLHSIVHLHHCVMEQIAGHTLPVPITSDLSSNRTAYNRYETPEITEQLASHAFQKVQQLVEQGAPINTRDDSEKEGFRYWECFDFIIPCGGTHLRDISEIGKFGVTFSNKKGKPKVSFDLPSSLLDGGDQ